MWFEWGLALTVLAVRCRWVFFFVKCKLRVWIPDHVHTRRNKDESQVASAWHNVPIKLKSAAFRTCWCWWIAKNKTKKKAAPHERQRAQCQKQSADIMFCPCMVVMGDGDRAFREQTGSMWAELTSFRQRATPAPLLLTRLTNSCLYVAVHSVRHRSWCCTLTVTRLSSEQTFHS